MGQRRLSQAISEGDGISLIVPVNSADDARTADAEGAEALLVRSEVWGIRDATSLPLLRIDSTGDADAFVLPVHALRDDEIDEPYAGLLDGEMECVVEVRDGEALEAALDRLDPEIFLLSPAADDQSSAAAIERVLDVLPDVPAGKLAIAHLMVTTRDEVAELERAGFDAVTVGTHDVASLAGAMPPEV